MQNTGTSRSAAAAAIRAGLSCSRRSRRIHTIAAVLTPRIARRRPVVDLPPAIFEHGREVSADECGVGQRAERSERQRVVDDVADLRSPVVGFELVPVMPEAIGAAHLAVHEAAAGMPFLDARHPSQRHAVQAQPVFDARALAHLDRLLGEDLEAQPGRGQRLEVARPREEVEHRVGFSGNDLLAHQALNQDPERTSRRAASSCGWRN